MDDNAPDLLNGIPSVTSNTINSTLNSTLNLGAHFHRDTHETISAMIGLFLFVPAAVIAVKMLVQSYSTNVESKSMKLQHFQRVYSLLVAYFAVRITDLFLASWGVVKPMTYLQQVIHNIPTLVAFSLFTYICYMFYHMYAVMRYTRDDLTDKIRTARNQFLLLNFAVYITYLAVSISTYFGFDVMNDKEKLYSYSAIVTGTTWLANCLLILIGGLRLYNRLMNTAESCGIVLDLSKLKKIMLVISAVGVVKVTVQVIKLSIGMTNAEKLEKMLYDLDMSSHFSNSAHQGISMVVIGVTVLGYLLGEILPFLFILYLMRLKTKEGSGTGRSKSLMQKFIKTPTGQNIPSPEQKNVNSSLMSAASRDWEYGGSSLK